MDIIEKIVYFVLPFTSVIGTLHLIAFFDKLRPNVKKFKKIYWIIYWIAFSLNWIIFAISSLISICEIGLIIIFPGLIIGNYLFEISHSWLLSFSVGIPVVYIWILILLPIKAFYDAISNVEKYEFLDLIDLKK